MEVKRDITEREMKLEGWSLAICWPSYAAEVWQITERHNQAVYSKKEPYLSGLTGKNFGVRKLNGELIEFK